MHRFLSSKGVGASTATQELLLLPPLELQLTEILDCRITNAKCLPQEGEQQPSKASETRGFILSGRQAGSAAVGLQPLSRLWLPEGRR